MDGLWLAVAVQMGAVNDAITCVYEAIYSFTQGFPICFFVHPAGQPFKVDSGKKAVYRFRSVCSFFGQKTCE